jgi:hypothetical protein
MLYQHANRQLGVDQMAASVAPVAPVGVKWGQKHEKQAARHVAAAQINSRFMGQVGQESNLQPAVLEPAAIRSAAFRGVHEPPENGPF